MPPVEDAAALIYEIWQEQDDDAENGLHQLLNEVPYEHRQQVMYLILEPNMASDDAGDSTAASDLQSAQHPAGTMRYVEDICGEDAALSLQQVMHESRELALRERLNGSPANYAGGDTHQLYVQCVANLQAAVEAKQAMNGQPWTGQELREAVQHEVNRMSYRLALEVQDRLIQQLTNYADIKRYIEENGTARADANEFAKLSQTPFELRLRLPADRGTHLRQHPRRGYTLHHQTGHRRSTQTERPASRASDGRAAAQQQPAGTLSPSAPVRGCRHPSRHRRRQGIRPKVEQGRH